MCYSKKNRTNKYEQYLPFGYEYKGCKKLNEVCENKDLLRFGKYDSKKRQDEAYKRCSDSEVKPPLVSTTEIKDSDLFPYDPLDGTKKINSLAFVQSIKKDKKPIPIYILPDRKGPNVLFEIKGDSEYIAILRYIEIYNKEWFEIVCFDKNKNRFEGWIEAKYVNIKNSNFVPRKEYKDLTDLENSLIAYNPIKPKQNSIYYSAEVINVVHDSTLNVRHEPTSKGKIISRLIKNAKNIRIEEKKGKWLKISFIDSYNFEHYGWVHGDYIQSESDQQKNRKKSNKFTTYNF